MSKFWKGLQNSMGTTLHFSITFYPKIDGQSQQIIQILDDMLRPFIIDFKVEWAWYLSLIEFSYNNTFQMSIGMAPYEALYNRKCSSLVCWAEVGEQKLLGLKLVQLTTDKIKII